MVMIISLNKYNIDTKNDLGINLRDYDDVEYFLIILSHLFISSIELLYTLFIYMYIVCVLSGLQSVYLDLIMRLWGSNLRQWISLT